MSEAEQPTVEKHAGGRPTKYEPRFADELIEFMGKGYSLTAFAGSICVARSTINVWMAENPEFSEAAKIGQARRTMSLEQGMLETDIGPRITARVFALKNADPEGWRDKQEVEHSGGVKVTRIELVGPDVVDS